MKSFAPTLAALCLFAAQADAEPPRPAVATPAVPTDELAPSCSALQCKKGALDLIPEHRIFSFVAGGGYVRYPGERELLDVTGGLLLGHREPVALALVAGAAFERSLASPVWRTAFEGGADLRGQLTSNGIVDPYLLTSFRLLAGVDALATRYGVGGGVVVADLATFEWRSLDVLYAPATGRGAVTPLSFALLFDLSTFFDMAGVWKIPGPPRAAAEEDDAVKMLVASAQSLFKDRAAACDALKGALGEPPAPIRTAARRAAARRGLVVKAPATAACPGLEVDEDDSVGRILQAMAAKSELTGPACEVLREELGQRAKWKQHLRSETCAACLGRTLGTKNSGLPYPSDLWSALECTFP